VFVDEGLWAAYDRMGLSFQEHAADSAFNAHYDRPAVLAALGPVTGLRVLDAACGPGLYLRELLERVSFSPGRPNLGDPAGAGFQRCQGRRIYNSAIGRVA
jgi:hypothetical protein